MRDLFSQCMYVCTCLSRSGMSICTHHGTHASRALTRSRGYRMPSLAASDGGQGRTALLDSGGRVGQRGWSSATYVFGGVECRTQLTVCGIEKEKSRYRRS